jgi:uncharacterized protein YqeY|tara:strand:+ start:6308 stop:6757 length:450 start_codon:yes stop_codon:yes gene_type:complete
MPLLTQINEDMKEALRSREKLKLSTLRSIRALFLNELKKDGSDSLSDATCILLLRRLAKQRKESIEAFSKAGRTEKAEQESEELAVIDQYLPSLADETTTTLWVKEAIQATGASSSKEVGKVMGHLMKNHKDEIDAGLAKNLLGKLLSD